MLQAPGNVNIIDHPYEVQCFHGILLDLFFCKQLLLALDDENFFFEHEKSQTKLLPTEDIIRTYLLRRQVRRFVAWRPEYMQVHIRQSPFKGHSQLVHMRTRYYFIANLHINEAQFLTKYNKNNITGMSQSTLKIRFFSKRLRFKQNTTKIEADFQRYFDFGLR